MLPESLRGEGKEREKTVLLAKAMDGAIENLWVREISPEHFTDEYTPDKAGGTFVRYRDKRGHAFSVDFYATENMALAWRVLNWGMRHRYTIRIDAEFFNIVPGAFELPPAEAQTAWLDKILTLCIEVGLVEVDDVA